MFNLIDKALQAILKMLKKKDERVLLWENASPTSEFDAQTISVDLTNYAMVYITYVLSTDNGRWKGMETVKGFSGVMDTTQTSRGANLVTALRYYAPTDTGVKFEKALTQVQGSSRSELKSYCIPHRIYGLKSGGGKLAKAIRKCLKGGVCYGC